MRNFKTNTNVSLPVFMTDTADHISGKTGLTLAVSAGRIGYDGAANTAYGALTLTSQFTYTEQGNGWYRLNLVLSGLSSLLGTAGTVFLHITATGADPTDIEFNLVGYNPANNIANQEDNASTAIAGSVWNALTASYNTASTFGAKLGSISITGTDISNAVWGALTASYVTSNTFGKFVQDITTNTKAGILGYNLNSDPDNYLVSTNYFATRLNKTYTYTVSVPGTGGMTDQGNTTANVEKWINIKHGSGAYDSSVALSSGDRLLIAKAVWGFDFSNGTTNESATFTSTGTYPNYVNVAGNLVNKSYVIMDDKLTNEHGVGAWSAAGTITANAIAQAVWEYTINGVNINNSAGKVLYDVPTAAAINTELTSSHGSGSWSQALTNGDINSIATTVWAYGTRRLSSAGVLDISGSIVTGGTITINGGLVESNVSKIAGVTVISNAGPSNNQWGRSS